MALRNKLEKVKVKFPPEESASQAVQIMQRDNFCRAFVRFANASKALKESGMSIPTRADAARQKAHKLLSAEDVKARIKEICHEIECKHAVNLDSIVAVHAGVIRANASETFDDDFKVLPKSKWSESLRRSVRKIDITEKYVGDVRIVETKIDFADKQASANALYKILGYESEQKLRDLAALDKSDKDDPNIHNTIIQRAFARAALAAKESVLRVEGS